jgi:hypothetical protein
VDAATAHLQQHAGHLCAVVVVDGQIVARYRVIVRGSTSCLTRESHHPVPSSPVPAEWLAPPDQPSPPTRPAELRDRSAALSSRSADLRSRSAAMVARVKATLGITGRE